MIIGILTMKFIYIKNYLDLSREEKFNFFKFLGNTDKMTVSHQRVVFGENALLLEFKGDTNIEEAKENIESFFKKRPEISVHVVNRIIQNKDTMILEFTNKKLRVRR